MKESARQAQHHEPTRANRLQVSVAYRWFRADQHYIGTTRQFYRQREGSQSINDVNLFDLELAYNLTPRWRTALTLPMQSDTRSQVARSGSGAILERFQTQAAGLRDIRMTVDSWLREPRPGLEWNLSLGMGMVMPTGKDSVKDVFEIYDRASGHLVARQQPVDTSIQPGAGGWGVLLRTSGFWQVGARARAYFEGSYVAMPQNTNGVASFLPNPYEAQNSIADSYGVRAGLEGRLPGRNVLNGSLGARLEGVPVHDLIGGSDGFRRPGYIWYIEPGLSTVVGRWTVGMKMPIGIYYNRLQSVPDQQQTVSTGVYTHGDAIYPKFSLLTSISARW